MANIVINEISQNYTYASGTSSFATIALPITACWGPGYVDPKSLSGIQSLCECSDADLADVVWQRFPSTQAGMEQFVATYRGPATNYRIAGDYSYQMALTLLSAGYDVLVCRLAPGSKADSMFVFASEDDPTGLLVRAKYPGSFGNNLVCSLSKKQLGSIKYWNLVVRVKDPTTLAQNAVENLSFTFDVSPVETSIPHISEITSKFVDLTVVGDVHDDTEYEPADGVNYVQLANGTDWMVTPDNSTYANDLSDIIDIRYIPDPDVTYVYKEVLMDYVAGLISSGRDVETELSKIFYTEWLYSSAYRVYDILKDKLAYNPQRIISPGWDDQNIFAYTDPSNFLDSSRPLTISPLHKKILDVAYHGRCAAGLIDIPQSCLRCWVYDESTETPGYAQMLARYIPEVAGGDINAELYTSHCGLFVNWAYFTLVGMTRPVHLPPSFLSLMIFRAQILNQPAQYEWLLPTNRKHNLKITKFDFTVPKHLLDEWQSLEGVGINVLTPVPDLGTIIWGNSTLFEVPPATYQALANLSTRYLVNAIEDLAYRCGVAITFQYNNSQAYDRFYAGCAPLLDTMVNQGAITDWYMRMAADIDGEDQVNANTVIGKIWIVVPRVINDIYVDLIALPPTVSLDQFRG